MRAARTARLLTSLAVGLLLLTANVAGATELNPAQRCGEDDIYVRETVWRGQTIVRELPIATRGGCASSWATGQMSVAAVVGQCKRLEEGVVMANGSFFQLTYPHVFYGLWEAENRSDCVKVLHGLATGAVDADVLPFPF